MQKCLINSETQQRNAKEGLINKTYVQWLKIYANVPCPMPFFWKYTLPFYCGHIKQPDCIDGWLHMCYPTWAFLFSTTVDCSTRIKPV